MMAPQCLNIQGFGQENAPFPLTGIEMGHDQIFAG